MTLGLRLHPSPPAAREGGWPGARGRAREPQRGGGPPGDGTQGEEEKRLRGSRVLPGNLHSSSPRLLREPGPGAGPIHCTPPAPQSKSCREARRTPPPLGLPQDSPAPRLPRTPAERGRGAVTGGRKERAFPERPDAGRVSCAPARPSPPHSGSWPIKPPNYAWAWSPLGPPAPGRHNQRARRPGRGSRKEVAAGRKASRPGRRRARPAAPRRQACPKARVVPGGQQYGPQGSPRRNHYVARVAAPFPCRVCELRADPETPPELGSNRLRKGHRAPGLGLSEGKLMAPNLGAPPRGRSLKSPARKAGGALSLPPPEGGRDNLQEVGKVEGSRGGQAGGGVAGDPDGGKTSLASCNRLSPRGNCCSGEAGGVMGAGEHGQSPSWKGFDVHRPSPQPASPRPSQARPQGRRQPPSLQSPQHVVFRVQAREAGDRRAAILDVPCLPACFWKCFSFPFSPKQRPGQENYRLLFLLRESFTSQ